jgi:hypothetical protein
MKTLLLSTFLMAAVTFAETPTMSPPERRIRVTSTGDVLEWQPGLGIVVLPHGRTRVETRVSRRYSSDAKSIVPLERHRQPAAPIHDADELMDELDYR